MPRRRRGPPARGDDAHPSLDLHGATAEEAVRLTRGWLSARRNHGDQVVVVITGRGLHSPGGAPVLRGEIELLLREMRGGVVEDFVPRSGGGAFLVYLTPPPRRRRPPGPSAPPQLGIDPELQRRAEENLRDLGVDPTPALVEAEIRRLQRRPDG